MRKLKLSALILASFMVVTTFAGCKQNPKLDRTQPPSETTAPVEFREITTMEITREMGVGINLGNTFEAIITGSPADVVASYETAWGSPLITQPLIQGYADEGFGVLRIPVAWSNMMGEDYTISSDYIARVRQVVDWALETGIYVILNIHWDGGWWTAFPTEKEECMYRYERFWTQISREFKDYNDYLMFESLNEEGGWEEMWNRYSDEGDKKASYDLLNEINQKFVDIIRTSGGNNEKRHLLIAGYNTDFELTSDEMFKIPNDKENRCAVSVHYYTPPTFALLDKDASWGKAKATWGTEKDIAELNNYFDMVKERFIDNGVPIIIGEYGVSIKNKTDEMVRLYMSSVTEAAYSRQMCPVVWDTTNVFYDRYSFKMKDPLLLEQLMAVKDK